MNQKTSIEALLSQQVFSTATLLRFKQVVDGLAKGSTIPEVFSHDKSQYHSFYRQLAALETALGGKALISRRKGVEHAQTTDFGYRLRNITAQYLQGLSDLASGTPTRPLTVTFAGGETTLRLFILAALPTLLKEFPDIHFTLRELAKPLLFERMGAGEIDFGILSTDTRAPALESVALGELHFCAFVRTDECPTPLPTGTAVFSAFKWAALAVESPILQRMETKARDAEEKFDVRLKCSSYPMMMDAVECLGFAALLPRMTQRWFKVPTTSIPLPLHKTQTCLRYSLFWNPRSCELRQSFEMLRPALLRCVLRCVASQLSETD